MTDFIVTAFALIAPTATTFLYLAWHYRQS